MEDSSIIYYIVIGAIYFLSKIFGKKKKPTTEHEYDQTEEAANRPAKSTSFDDIFKELTGQTQENYSPEEITKPLESSTSSSKPVLAPDILDFRKLNEESIAPIEPVDIPNDKHQRKSLVFEREEHFALKEDDNELRDGVLELLQNHEGLRQAVVLREVLDRKY